MMPTAVSTSIQNDGAVYLYNEIGQYMGSRRAHSGKAVSAMINGSNLIIQNSKGKTEVYKVRGGNTTYAYTR
jgi:hypothetical protein